MVKQASSNAVKTPTSNAKSGKTKAPAASADRVPAIQLASRLDEHRIRERAYSIWIEEGRPHGCDLAHWRRAHAELQQGARWRADLAGFASPRNAPVSRRPDCRRPGCACGGGGDRS